MFTQPAVTINQR